MTSSDEDEPKTNPEVEEPSRNKNKRRRESSPTSSRPAKRVKISTEEDEEQPTSTSRLRNAPYFNQQNPNSSQDTGELNPNANNDNESSLEESLNLVNGVSEESHENEEEQTEESVDNDSDNEGVLIIDEDSAANEENEELDNEDSDEPEPEDEVSEDTEGEVEWVEYIESSTPESSEQSSPSDEVPIIPLPLQQQPVQNPDQSPEQEQPNSNRGDRIDLNSRTDRLRLQRETELQARVKLSNAKAATLEQFQILRQLGVGRYGKVFLVRKLSGLDAGQLYAMKIISKMVAVNNWKSAERIKNERRILEAIQGLPFMLTLHYAFQSGQHLCLVTNFVQGGEMFRHLQLEAPLPESAVRLYVAELVLALEALHRRNIVYRDLKLENILIDHDGHIVVADLGLATILTAEKRFRTKTFCGTLDYMAPEVLRTANNSGYGTAIDWWALGVFTFELLTGTNRFASLTVEEIRQRIFTENLVMPSHLSVAARDFLRRLMEIDPSRRMDAAEARAHEFLQGIDWSVLAQKQHEMPYRPTIQGIDDVSHFDPEFTAQPIELPLCQDLPTDLRMFMGFGYTSPQILERGRVYEEEDIEFRNPNADNIPTLPDDFVLGRCLSGGGNGTCFVVNQTYVAKVIHLSRFHVAEVDAMMTFSHDNIVEYHGTYRNGCEIWIIMEYLRGTNLGHAFRNYQMHESVSRLFFRQLVSAIQHMHSHHFIHGDLKPENIVLASERDFTIKLVDFGLARYCREFQQWTDYARYTPQYAPPELMSDSPILPVTYTPAVDIYGLGVMLYWMGVGHGPYLLDSEIENSVDAQDDLEDRIKHEPFDRESEGWLNASQAYRDLVSWCLEKDPADRPSLEDIVNSEWWLRSDEESESESEDNAGEEEEDEDL